MSVTMKIVIAVIAVTLASLIFKKQREKIAAMGTYQILSWIFDNPIWWYVELTWKGKGVAGIMLVTLFLNIGLLAYYRRKKISWLCWDIVDEIGNKWYLKRKLGDPFMFFLLSVVQDPFITTSFLRHGQNDGLKSRDYTVFFASCVVSIGYWAIRNGLLTEFILRPILKV